MGNTQALPGLVAAGDATAAAEPHEVIYEQALRQIAALDETWQEAVRGVAVPVASVPVLPAPAAAVAVPHPAPAPVPPLPPLPRAPMTVTAEITAIAGPETAEAVVARAAAPRWRRSLAY